MPIKNLAAIKKCLISVIYQLSQNNMMIQINYSLQKWKMRLEVLQLTNLLDWSQKMYLLLVDNNKEDKKAKDTNRNVVATISHNEYKILLLNNKFLRH